MRYGKHGRSNFLRVQHYCCTLSMLYSGFFALCLSFMAKWIFRWERLLLLVWLLPCTHIKFAHLYRGMILIVKLWKLFRVFVCVFKREQQIKPCKMCNPCKNCRFLGIHTLLKPSNLQMDEQSINTCRFLCPLQSCPYSYVRFHCKNLASTNKKYFNIIN